GGNTPSAQPTVMPTMSPRPTAAAPNVSVTPMILNRNTAGLAPADMNALMGGGSLGSKKWLYPYAGTVFPRGTVAPVLMWDADPTADAMYVHIKSRAFEYTDFLKPMNAVDANSPLLKAAAAVAGAQPAPLLQIPQDVWVQAGMHAQGKTDLF